MWALDCAQIPLEHFELKYPNETRPRTCLEVSKSWARGEVKMPLARRAILNAHAVAKEIDDPEYGALCHAIGHAGATVHAKGHAIGLPMYELTAIVIKYGKADFHKPVKEKIDCYTEQLLYWEKRTAELKTDWADFLINK